MFPIMVKAEVETKSHTIFILFIRRNIELQSVYSCHSIILYLLETVYISNNTLHPIKIFGNFLLMEQ